MVMWLPSERPRVGSNAYAFNGRLAGTPLSRAISHSLSPSERWPCCQIMDLAPSSPTRFFFVPCLSLSAVPRESPLVGTGVASEGASQPSPSRGPVPASATGVLAEEADFPGMNEEWLKWLPSNPPHSLAEGPKVFIAAIAET